MPHPTPADPGPVPPNEPAHRGSWRRLLLSLAVVLSASAVFSHLAAAALGIEYATVNRFVVRPDLRGAPVALLGSSIALYGLAHEPLAERLGRPLKTWFVPSGSPAELETLRGEAGQVPTTILGLSLYDMNELVLADRRPELVPVRRAAADLREASADWAFTKRVLGQYLLHGTARVFPTAGKSDLVMVGIRAAARDASAGRWPARRLRLTTEPPGPAAPEAVVFDPRNVPDLELTLDEWPRELRLRSVANYRASGRAHHAFSGPKWLALQRLVNAARPGELVVVVFPVSPLYASEFLDGAALAAFDAQMERLSRTRPGAVLRLDREAALQQDRAFRDLVHLGPEGRRHATAAVAAHLLQP